MSLKTEERAQRIVVEILRRGDVSISDLMKHLKISAPSIRRDLALLEQRGLIRRTHGGATLVEPLLYEPFRYDSSFQLREQSSPKEKRRIALAAADLIQEHETVGITAGTTTTQIARSVRHRRNISIVTNAINIGMELCNLTGLKTYMTGGFVQWAWSFSLIGPTAIQSLQNTIMDRLFLGVCGISAERGATTIEPDEGMVFRTMVQQARQVIVVADSTKLGVITPTLICPPTAIHLLITDTNADPKTLEALRATGLEVMTV